MTPILLTVYPLFRFSGCLVLCQDRTRRRKRYSAAGPDHSTDLWHSMKEKDLTCGRIWGTLVLLSCGELSNPLYLLRTISISCKAFKVLAFTSGVNIASISGSLRPFGPFDLFGFFQGSLGEHLLMFYSTLLIIQITLPEEKENRIRK